MYGVEWSGVVWVPVCKPKEGSGMIGCGCICNIFEPMCYVLVVDMFGCLGMGQKALCMCVCVTALAREWLSKFQKHPTSTEGMHMCVYVRVSWFGLYVGE